MRYSNIFWGVILITIGALFFLKNLDIIWFSWRAIFRLWPLLLVLWGISILPIKNLIKLLLSFAAVFITILVIYFSPQTFRYHGWDIWDLWGNNDNIELKWDDEKDNKAGSADSEKTEEESSWDTQDYTEPFDEAVEQAVLRFDAAVGEFTISESTDELIEFRKKGNLGPYKVISKSYENKKIIALDLKKKQFRGTNLRNISSLKLNENPIWDMEVDVGAADIDMDLSLYKMNQIEIDGGASAIQVKLGDRYEKTILNIDAGASSIKIYVPETSGCILDFDTFLISKNIEGFEKTESGNYKTDNYSDAENKVIVNLDAAVSSFKIFRY